MGDYAPVNTDSFSITLTVGSGGVTGRQLLKMSADDTVVPCAATTDVPVGVAAFDAVAGGRVTVLLLPGYLHELPLDSGVAATFGTAVFASGVTPGRISSVAGTVKVGTVVRGGTGNAGGTAYARVLGA
jgi:hypothetical protein